MGLLNIFKGGAEGLASGVKGILDKFIADKVSPAEMAKIEAEAQQEVNRHVEAMLKATTEELDSARRRESDFVKATGHIDWFMTLFGAAIVLMFAWTVYVSTVGSIPADMKEIFIESRAAVRDIVVGIAAYYWGSSAGSRIKDMKGKS